MAKHAERILIWTLALLVGGPSSLCLLGWVWWRADVHARRDVTRCPSGEGWQVDVGGWATPDECVRAGSQSIIADPPNRSAADVLLSPFVLLAILTLLAAVTVTLLLRRARRQGG